MTGQTASESTLLNIGAFFAKEELSDQIKIALLNQHIERERFERTQFLKTKRWKYSIPLAVAFTRAITTGLNFVFAILRQDQQFQSPEQSATKGFQYTILSRKLEKDTSPEQKANARLFFVEAGLLDDLNVTYLVGMAQQSREKIPQIGWQNRSDETNALGELSNNNYIYDMIFRLEGGFVSPPSDPDGAMNMGISRRWLEAWRDAPVAVDDVKKLSENEAREIYLEKLTSLRAGEIENIFLRAVYVQAAINLGDRRAISLLQELGGELERGALDRATVTRVNQMARENERETVLAYYKSLVERRPSMEVFMKGWSRRLSEFTPRGDLSVCSG